MLTRLDMSDRENLKDAEFELSRAGNDADRLAVWAAKWGEALLERIDDVNRSGMSGTISRVNEDIRAHRARLTGALRKQRVAQ